MSESRRETRVEEHLVVSASVRTAPQAKELEGQIFFSRTENISISGMKLNTGIPLPVGSVLDLKVLLKNSKIKYEIIADVVWTDVTNAKNILRGFVGDVGVTLTIYPNSQQALWNSAVAELH